MEKKLSFADAAFEMERICEQLDEVEDIGVLIQEVFNNAKDDLKSAIDRRIKFIKYAESQILIAKDMRDQWATRAERFEKTIEQLKKNTIDVMKANPALPYKGTIGAFKIYKNSQPSMTFDYDTVELSRRNIEVVDRMGTCAPSEYVTIQEVRILDKARLKEDIKNGKEVAGVSLEYGEHVRMNLNI